MSKRISLLASYTKGYKVICDIGCDHGLTIIEALSNYDIEFAYAIDINKEPLERAKINISKNNLSNQVSFLLSDGLKQANIDFDLAIISGMGGLMINKIISESIAKFKGKDLLLSPQGDNNLVRLYLAQLGYAIVKEEAIIDNNKYYEILLAKPNKKSYNYLELYYGPIIYQKRPIAALKHYQKLLAIKEKAYNITKKVDLLVDINLYKYFLEDKMNKVNYYKENYYTTLFIDEKPRDLIVIFPGGGYDHTSPREAENVGFKYSALGFNVIVFHYRETLDDYKTLFKNIADAIKTVPTKVTGIYLNGFSAGGHLAMHLANKLDLYGLTNVLGVILCYPVISAKKECIHQGSFANLLGADLAKKDLFSEELNVNKNSPKLFIWHTITDESVPVLNSLYLIEAYQKLGLNFEAHFYNTGGHGLSLATSDAVAKSEDANSHIASWFNLVSEWLLQ